MVLILVHLLQVQSPDLDLEMAVALLYSLISEENLQESKNSNLPGAAIKLLHSFSISA